jgi:hypothetical protein
LITVVAFTVFVIVDKIGSGSSVLRWSALGTFVAVPAALLVSILLARLARSSIGDLFIELRANPAPEHLRDALAHALRDPSLLLAYWLPEYETYADLDGRPIELPEDSGRATTLVERDGARLAALVHDASLRDDPALLERVMVALARRLDLTVGLLYDVALRRVADRLGAVEARLRPVLGGETARLNRRDLGALVGARRETVCRAVAAGEAA